MADPYAAFSSPVAQSAPPADPYAAFSSPVDAPRNEQPPVTAMERVNAGASGVNEGVLRFIAQMGPDAIANVMNLAKVIGGLGWAAGQKLTGHEVDIPQALQVQDEDRSPVGDLLVNAANKLPGRPVETPRPDDTASRYLHAAGMGAASAVLAPAAGAKVIASIISGVAGAEAQQAAAEHGASPLVQTAAGVFGGLAPSAMRAGVAEGTRQIARGGEEGRQRVAQNITDFENAGTSPSIGQATESRLARSTESLLAKTPGGAGRMAAKADAQSEQLGSNIERMASQLAAKASGEQAGRAIQRGVAGEGGFVETFKKKQEALYDELDQHISKEARVDVTATAAALRELNQDIPGAPNISEFFKNAKIKGIEGALKADTEGASALKARPDVPEFSGARGAATPKADMDLAASILNDGKLPYEAVKKLRTLVGREMADSSIMSDVPRSKWTALYAALSSDLEGAAGAAGPKATAAFNRANNYTRAGMKRLEVLDSVVDKNGGPEAVFRAATSGAKEGATTLRAVMQSLPESAQKTFSASVLRRLGRAKAGNQDNLGERFSTETFLTNWNSMSPQAKATLFDRYGPGFRSDMDAVAKSTSNMREGSAVFRNSSGTSQSVAQTSTAVAFVTALATGHYGTAGAIAGGVSAANLAARVMTNPTAVRWLAQTTKAPKSALPALINRAAKSDDQDLRELAALMKKGKQQ